MFFLISLRVRKTLLDLDLPYLFIEVIFLFLIKLLVCHILYMFSLLGALELFGLKLPDLLSSQSFGGALSQVSAF